MGLVLVLEKAIESMSHPLWRILAPDNTWTKTRYQIVWIPRKYPAPNIIVNSPELIIPTARNNLRSTRSAMIPLEKDINLKYLNSPEKVHFAIILKGDLNIKF